MASCGNNENLKLDERVQHWKLVLDENVPLGTSKEAIDKWASENSIEFSENPTLMKLFANVEQVPDTGIGFPCSEWNIILEVQLDKNRLSKSNSISTVGSCI